MKKTALLFVVVAMIGCNNASNEATTTPPVDTAAAAAPKEETPPPPPPMDSAAMMKKWQECMTPGEMHKWMASMNGKWTTEGKFWMDEKAPPTESKGTCENKMVLNGLYQESVHKSMMMGMPFEGHGTLAYDINRKVFISTWIDNMGSSIMILEGTYDDASKTLTLKGPWEDPIKGKMEIRETCKMIDDKTQMMEMYGIQGGKEMKWMEIKLAKK